jgi:hypothetical protein
MKLENGTDWQTSTNHVFWGEIAPCDHVVQIYENDTVFLDSLAGFVAGGITSDECVIVIATEAHINALENRLKTFRFHVDELIENDTYIPLNAEETLSKFMVNGWPDENLFMQTVSTLIAKARSRNKRVRAFGEMVALLWAQGHNGATVQLEHLWNKFCATEAFCLFCAYPKSGFTGDVHTSINHICNTHSKVIAGWNKSDSEIFYKNVG